jgi:hypothetical protein
MGRSTATTSPPPWAQGTLGVDSTGIRRVIDVRRFEAASGGQLHGTVPRPQTTQAHRARRMGLLHPRACSAHANSSFGTEISGFRFFTWLLVI